MLDFVETPDKIEMVRSWMKQSGIDNFLISQPEDIAWLSGFTGTTAYILITKENAVFITDGRYEEQCRGTLDTAWSIEIVKSYAGFMENLALSLKKITLEQGANIGLYEKFSKHCSVTVDTDDILLHLRMIKNRREVQLIKDEYDLAAQAFLESLEKWRFGEAETKWAAQLEYQMKIAGACGPSFETIVASGVRGALPHGTASSKIIDPLDAVTVDFGSKRLYNSDFTRVVYNGDDSGILNIIDVVRVALEKAIDAVKPGVGCSELDKTARDYIDECGYGKYFVHSLGHGVGANVHELPYISTSSGFHVEPGMVFTIEPGIYIPGSFGVRLEQTVLADETSCILMSDMLDKYIYKIEN